MKRPRSGSTVKQVAYATRALSGQATSKKENALLSGYSMTMAENAKHKIEDTEGYKNALLVLHTKSNNLLLKLMTEFELRGLKDFNNRDLISALNAISSSWDRIEKHRAPNKLKTPEGNPLRAILMEQTTTRSVTIESAPPEASASANEPVIHEAEEVKEEKEKKEKKEDDPMDF